MWYKPGSLEDAMYLADVPRMHAMKLKYGFWFALEMHLIWHSKKGFDDGVIARALRAVSLLSVDIDRNG